VFPTACKSVPFSLGELKADGDKWVVRGLASTFGNRDHVGDVIMRGAFDATLASSRKRRFLWQHYTDEPIGVEQKLEVTDEGLLGTWKISKTARGIDAYELLKDGAVDSLSIGYHAVDFEYDDAGIRLLKEIDLLEVSLVSIPANDRAVITQVKADMPFGQLLKQVEAALLFGVGEAKALATRRAADERELSERHTEAIQDLLAKAEAAATDLAALLHKPEAEADGASEAKADDGALTEATPESAATDVSVSAPSAPDLRLERLARARKKHAKWLLEHGLLEWAS
jgi:HK97 family phage prohead protease